MASRASPRLSVTETSLIDRLSRRRHRAAAAAALAGAAGSFALPPFGLVPLVAALSLPALQLGRATSSGEAGLIAGAAGFGWFLASLWWISLSLVTGNTGHWPLIPLPLFGIPLLLALFWVPAGVLAHRLGRSAPARVLWFAATLTICEWARGHVATGFPWNAPGYLFSAHVSLLQNASFLGLYGLSFLALLWAFAAAIWKLGRRRSAFAMVLILPLAALAGLVRLERLPDPPGDTPSKVVRLVQPAVPQDEKWNRAARAGHLETLRTLSRDIYPIPQLVIWPETAFAGLLDREGELFRDTVWSVLPFDGRLITGVPRFDAEKRLFNSAALVTPRGDVEALYDKRRLVPFGEFVPFRRFLPFADAIAGPVDFSPGAANTLFAVSGYGKMRLLICYETLFPGIGAGSGDRPDILVNLTNDAWFGRTPGPWQHLAQARMRAVEEGIPILRVANTGITAAFDGAGRQLGMIGLGEAGFVDIAVPPRLEPPVYAQWREVIWLLIVAVFCGAINRLDRKGSLGQ